MKLADVPEGATFVYRGAAFVRERSLHESLITIRGQRRRFPANIEVLMPHDVYKSGDELVVNDGGWQTLDGRPAQPSEVRATAVAVYKKYPDALLLHEGKTEKARATTWNAPATVVDLNAFRTVAFSSLAVGDSFVDGEDAYRKVDAGAAVGRDGNRVATSADRRVRRTKLSDARQNDTIRYEVTRKRGETAPTPLLVTIVSFGLSDYELLSNGRVWLDGDEYDADGKHERTDATGTGRFAECATGTEPVGTKMLCGSKLYTVVEPGRVDFGTAGVGRYSPSVYRVLPSRFRVYDTVTYRGEKHVVLAVSRGLPTVLGRCRDGVECAVDGEVTKC